MSTGVLLDPIYLFFVEKLVTRIFKRDYFVYAIQRNCDESHPAKCSLQVFSELALNGICN